LSVVYENNIGGRKLTADLIRTRCPNCSRKLKLRVPEGSRSGQFQFECGRCGESFIIDIPDRRGRSLNVVPVARGISLESRSEEKEKGKDENDDRRGRKRSRVTLDESPDPSVKRKRAGVETDEGKLPAKMKAAAILLIIVGLLGITYSILTVSGAFILTDLEEKSEGDSASLAVWVIETDTGRSVAAVNVTLTTDDGRLTSLTDEEGLVIFDDLKVGTHPITLFKAGYISREGDVLVTKGTPNVIDVPMEPGDENVYEPIPTKQYRSEVYRTTLTNFMAVLMMISSILAFLGAYFVMKREFFALALGLAFISSFSVGFLLSTLLAVISLLLIILSYDDFYHNYRLKRFLEVLGKEEIKRLFTREEEKRPALPPVRRRSE